MHVSRAMLRINKSSFVIYEDYNVERAKSCCTGFPYRKYIIFLTLLCTAIRLDTVFDNDLWPPAALIESNIHYKRYSIHTKYVCWLKFYKRDPLTFAQVTLHRIKHTLCTAAVQLLLLLPM